MEDTGSHLGYRAALKGLRDGVEQLLGVPRGLGLGVR